MTRIELPIVKTLSQDKHEGEIQVTCMDEATLYLIWNV
jgi:hypothetical protein